MTTAAEVAAERQKAEYEADLEIQKETLKAMLDVAKGSLERSQTSADFVQKVAAALAGAYTTLIAIVFSIKDNPLPPRGFIPTFFFALAAGLATAYLAFLTKPDVTRTTAPSNLPRLNSVKKVTTFINWTNGAVMRRAQFLRGAVVALFFGIFFFPVALLSSTPTASATGSTTTTTQAATPTASPAWPSPPASATAGELELYKAQLQAHVAALAAPAATPAPVAQSEEDQGVDAFAVVAAMVATVVVLVVSAGWIPRTTVRPPSAYGEIPGPAATPE